jgi:hypothetical protein
MTDKNLTSRLRARLADVTERYRAELDIFERIVADPATTFAALDEADGRVKKLSAERTHLMEELRLAQFDTPERYGRYRLRARQRPMREQVLDIVDELSVPVSPRVVSDYATVVLNFPLSPARFASLRRDEARAYQRDPNARPAWVVPAINVKGLSSIPRLVASSGWEPERRLIGARTLRVNHLKVLLALIRRLSAFDANAQPKGLAAMAYRFAAWLPTANNADLESVNAAAQSELEAIEPEDEAERTSAAVTLCTLPPQFQLWGRPVLLEGGNAANERAML